MQREALIILAALLTIAVLAAGPGPAQTAAIDGSALQKEVAPVAEQQATEQKITAEKQFGPVQFQMVGVHGEKTATLTVNLDLAI